MNKEFNLFVKAINYATEKHAGQFRLDGKPYITHPLEVASSVDDYRSKTVAILHDVLEDTNTTYEELNKEFGADISIPVFILTKSDKLDYEDYIMKIKFSNNDIVTSVKIADLKHNLSTIDNIKDLEKRERLKSRYVKALEVLEN